MRLPFLLLFVIFISLSAVALAIELGDDNAQQTEDICQNINCEKQPGLCMEGYFCFLAEVSLPDDIRCSKSKMNDYLEQKITESRLAIEADSSHIGRYYASVMDEQLSKGCILNELKPIFIEGKSHIKLTSEFINYQANAPLTLGLNWYLVDRVSKNEIDVTKYCTSEITLNPSEHRLVTCLITELILLDPSYDYYATGTYTLFNGGTETKISEKARVVSALDIATQIANAVKSLGNRVSGGVDSFFDWINSFLGKSLCDKTPSICLADNFCYLTDSATLELNTVEKMNVHISENSVSFGNINADQLERGCLPEDSKEFFRLDKTKEHCNSLKGYLNRDKCTTDPICTFDSSNGDCLPRVDSASKEGISHCSNHHNCKWLDEAGCVDKSPSDYEKENVKAHCDSFKGQLYKYECMTDSLCTYYSPNGDCLPRVDCHSFDYYGSCTLYHNCMWKGDNCIENCELISSPDACESRKCIWSNEKCSENEKLETKSKSQILSVLDIAIVPIGYDLPTEKAEFENHIQIIKDFWMDNSPFKECVDKEERVRFHVLYENCEKPLSSIDSCIDPSTGSIKTRQIELIRGQIADCVWNSDIEAIMDKTIGVYNGDFFEKCGNKGLVLSDGIILVGAKVHFADDDSSCGINTHYENLLGQVSAHELGHVFGCDHCQEQECIMKQGSQCSVTVSSECKMDIECPDYKFCDCYADAKVGLESGQYLAGCQT